jgi:hypothetical protein
MGHEAVGLDGSQQFVAMARSHSQCESDHASFTVVRKLSAPALRKRRARSCSTQRQRAVPESKCRSTPAHITGLTATRRSANFRSTGGLPSALSRSRAPIPPRDKTRSPASSPFSLVSCRTKDCLLLTIDGNLFHTRPVDRGNRDRQRPVGCARGGSTKSQAGGRWPPAKRVSRSAWL